MAPVLFVKALCEPCLLVAYYSHVMKSPPLISIKTGSSSLISRPHAPASTQPFLQEFCLFYCGEAWEGFWSVHSSPSTVSFFLSENARSLSQALSLVGLSSVVLKWCHYFLTVLPPFLGQDSRKLLILFLLCTVFSLDDGRLSLSLLLFALNVSGTFSVLSTKTIGLQKSRLQRMQPEKCGPQASLPPVSPLLVLCR